MSHMHILSSQATTCSCGSSCHMAVCGIDCSSFNLSSVSATTLESLRAVQRRHRNALKVLDETAKLLTPCGKQHHNQALMAVGPGKQVCLEILCNAQVCGPKEPRQQLLHEQRPAGALDAAVSAEALCC